jgi:AcrR family transcriptional regulator
MAGRQREGEATRRKLLDEALRMLAERGHAGVSVRDLTAAAGTNIAAIAYHFGNKDGLYRAVLDGVYAKLAEALTAAPGRPDELMRAAWAFAIQHRLGVRVLLRHFLDHGRHDGAAFDRWSEMLMGAADARVAAIRPDWAPIRRRIFLVAAMHLVVRLAAEDHGQLASMLGDPPDVDAAVEGWLVGWVQRELG